MTAIKSKSSEKGRHTKKRVENNNKQNQSNQQLNQNKQQHLTHHHKHNDTIDERLRTAGAGVGRGSDMDRRRLGLDGGNHRSDVLHIVPQGVVEG